MNSGTIRHFKSKLASNKRREVAAAPSRRARRAIGAARPRRPWSKVGKLNIEPARPGPWRWPPVQNPGRNPYVGSPAERDWTPDPEATSLYLLMEHAAREDAHSRP